MKGVNLPVSFINNVDPAFDVPFAKDANGAARRLYSPTDFPFDPAEHDVNGLHEFVAHFLCLAIKVTCTSTLAVAMLTMSCKVYMLYRYTKRLLRMCSDTVVQCNLSAPMIGCLSYK